MVLASVVSFGLMCEGAVDSLKELKRVCPVVGEMTEIVQRDLVPGLEVFPRLVCFVEMVWVDSGSAVVSVERFSAHGFEGRENVESCHGPEPRDEYSIPGTGQ